MNQVVIYKDAEGVVQCGFLATDMYPVEEAASVIVPEGNPFLVVTRDDIPHPPYHNAIDPDFSNPAGISIGADKIRAKWEADKAKAFEEANAKIKEEVQASIAEHRAAIEAARVARQDSVEGA